MAAEYKVFSVQETTVPVTAVFDGVEVEGRLPAMIVELVGAKSYQKTVTHVEMVDTAEKLEAARALFQVDVVLELGFTPKEGA